MARKTKEETERTYNALLEAAADLFHKQGYARTTINEVAEHAGMTRGAFYWHFQSMQEVARGIWERQAYPAINPIREKMTRLPQDNPARFFREQLNALLDLIDDDDKVARAMFIVMHNMEISEKESELTSFFEHRHKMFQDSICDAMEQIHAAGQLREGMDPQKTAMGCVCLFVGLVNTALLPFNCFDLKTEGRVILDTFLDAIFEPQ